MLWIQASPVIRDVSARRSLLWRQPHSSYPDLLFCATGWGRRYRWCRVAESQRGRWLHAAYRSPQGLKNTIFYIFDIGVASIQGIDFRLMHIDSGNIEAGSRKLHGKRQPHIPEAQNTNACRFLYNPFP